MRKHIRSVPCFFASNGLEMQMSSETFDLLWNSPLNAELTDSETSSSFGEGDKNDFIGGHTIKHWMEKAGRRILQ